MQIHSVSRQRRGRRRSQNWNQRCLSLPLHLPSLPLPLYGPCCPKCSNIACVYVPSPTSLPLPSPYLPSPPLQWEEAESSYKQAVAHCNDCQYQVHVTAQVSHVTAQVSHVTAQVSHVTAQVSHVTHVTAQIMHVHGHTI